MSGISDKRCGMGGSVWNATYLSEETNKNVHIYVYIYIIIYSIL